MFVMAAVVGLGLMQPGCAEVNAPLKLSVHTGAGVYRPGEPIDVTLSLVNISSGPVTVNGRLDFPRPEVYMEIRDAGGRMLMWHPPIPPPPLRSDDFREIVAGEAITWVVADIGEYLADRPGPGTYTLTATYTNGNRGSEFGFDAWAGKIVSNQAVFRIEAGPAD